jgi:hypothetical protein
MSLPFGEKKYCYDKENHVFQISNLLQELTVYAGALDCYEHCNKVTGKFLSFEVSAPQTGMMSWTGNGKNNQKEMNLRVVYITGQWEKVIRLAKSGIPFTNNDIQILKYLF